MGEPVGIITKRAYARIGLFGNPSDGYFGKTISVSIKNFFAEVQLTPNQQPFSSVGDGAREEKVSPSSRVFTMYSTSMVCASAVSSARFALTGRKKSSTKFAPDEEAASTYTFHTSRHNRVRVVT